MEKGTGSKWRKYLTSINGCRGGRKIKTNYQVGINSGCDRERICVVDVVPSNYHSFIHSTKQRSSKNNIYDLKNYTCQYKVWSDKISQSFKAKK